MSYSGSSMESGKDFEVVDTTSLLNDPHIQRLVTSDQSNSSDGLPSLTSLQSKDNVPQISHMTDTNTHSDCMSRIKQLEENNLFLRQELDRLKRQRTMANSKAATEDKGMTEVKKRHSSDDDVESQSMGKSTSRIVEAQSEAMSKLCDKQQSLETQSWYTPSSSPSVKDSDKKEMVLSEVHNLSELVHRLEGRLNNLELQDNSQGNEDLEPLRERIFQCSEKIDGLNHTKQSFETQIGQLIADMAEQRDARERTFQAFVMYPNSNVDLVKNRQTVLNDCRQVFRCSPHFAEDTCVYTVPATGLYEFYVRWRQNDDGKLQVRIHWSDAKISNLGRTMNNSGICSSSIRRFLEEGVRVWLSVQLVSGKAKLGSCDFGGSFIAGRAI